jgi:energy-converting hydrogenase B subunit K
MSIDSTKCVKCGTCKGVCPMGAISTDITGLLVIDTEKCVHCGACAMTCPMGAIADK